LQRRKDRWLHHHYHHHPLFAWFPTYAKRYILESISNGAQYVTPDSKIYCQKVKMCRFSSGNWFFCTKFVQLDMVSKRRNTAVNLQKRV
jgi:hypothetical protein